MTIEIINPSGHVTRVKPKGFENLSGLSLMAAVKEEYGGAFEQIRRQSPGAEIFITVKSKANDYKRNGSQNLELL